MERDLRDTPLYREIEQHFLRTHEPAFGSISWATDAAPSPDGATIAFTGSRLERLEGTPAGRICAVDVERGGVEQLTSGPNDDRSARWSPDGSRLAFLSDRTEKGRFQLFLLTRGRLGEAHAAPVVEGSVEYLEWSPDGGRILLCVAGPGADLPGVQGSGTTEVSEGDLPSWVPSVKSSAEDGGWRRAWIFDVDERTVRAASREGLNVWEATWCGTDRLAAIVGDGPGEDTWYTAPLALIDVESGKEQILLRSDVQLGLPSASPDGARLSVVQALCSDRMVIAGDLLLVDLESGDPAALDTQGVDVTHVAWRDATRLAFCGVRGQETVFGEVDATGGASRIVWVDEATCGHVYPEARPIGDDGVAIVRQSYERYPEIAIVTPEGARTIATLSHPGAEYVRGIGGSMGLVEWTSKDGRPISGLLVRPAGDAMPHPLVVSVHGGPISLVQSRWPSTGLSPLLASRGYAVLFPNPRGSTGRGQAFASEVYGDGGGADAQDILTGIDALVERGIADPARVGVMGGSYGGFMTAWLVTQTDRFAAAVAISPVTDWYSQHFTSNIAHWDRAFLEDAVDRAGGEYFTRSPVMFASRARTPTLVTAGGVDECTPAGQAIEFHRALREAGVETDLAVYPEEGHGVRKFPALLDYTTRVVAWFERHMPARR
ncbi:MAG TPA: S9 family peptidase [Actinomycetota bacterium]